MQFTTAKERFVKLYGAIGRQSGLRAETLESYAIWKEETRALLARLIGLPGAAGLPAPEATTLETVQEAGYTRTHLMIHTEPDVDIPAYLLTPVGLKAGERRPVVLAPHGHASHGKDAVAGVRRTAAIAGTIEQHAYDYGVQLVREGFIVLCPDAMGFGERREAQLQADDRMLDSSCALINHMALPLGHTLTGLWVADLQRLLDFVIAQPYTLPGRVACAGLSGGGLQTLWLLALDDRLRCAVVSGYFYGVKQSLLEMNGNCSCNYVPGLWKHVDMGDLGALAAPTPLLIVTGDADPLNGRDGLDNVFPQVDIARRGYRLQGVETSLEHHVFSGVHRWEGSQAIPFLRKHLFG